MSLLNKTLLLFTFYASIILAQDCTSEIIVETDNPAVKIYLNNKLTGTGNLKKELNEGSYTLRVVKDSLSWNPKTYIDSFEVAGCNDNKHFNYSFNNQVYLRTDPEDSYVFKNDSLLGHTPLFITKDFGSIKLSKVGYEEKEISMNDLSHGKIIELNYTGKETEPLFIKKDIFKILVGSAVVLGGVTAYFKLKADTYFEDYQFTGGKDLLDKTRQYDLISGITFGALQINFGFLIYYFLTE